MTLFACLSVTFFLALVDPPVSPKSFRDYITIGVGYTNLPNTAALSTDQVDRWSRILATSEAQTTYLQFQYTSIYLGQHNAFYEREALNFVRASEAAGKIRETVGSGSAAYIEALEGLEQMRRRWRVGLEGIENHYLDTLVPILTPEQQDRLPILRREAARRQARTMTWSYRWVNVELRQVWEQVDSTDAVSNEMMSRLLEDYEVNLTPLLCRFSDLQWMLLLDQARLWRQLEEGRLSPVERNERVSALRREYAGALGRVTRLTEQTVQAAGAMLPPETAAAFVLAAKSVAFREIYPDTTSLHRLFASLRDSNELEAATRDLVDFVERAYGEEYDQANRAAEALCMKWSDQLANGVQGFEPQFLRSALDPLLKARQEIGTKWLTLLRERLGDQLIDAHLARTPDALRHLRQEATATGPGITER